MYIVPYPFGSSGIFIISSCSICCFSLGLEEKKKNKRRILLWKLYVTMICRLGFAHTRQATSYWAYVVQVLIPTAAFQSQSTAILLAHVPPTSMKKLNRFIYLKYFFFLKVSRKTMSGLTSRKILEYLKIKGRKKKSATHLNDALAESSTLNKPSTPKQIIKPSILVNNTECQIQLLNQLNDGNFHVQTVLITY